MTTCKVPHIISWRNAWRHCVAGCATAVAASPPVPQSTKLQLCPSIHVFILNQLYELVTDKFYILNSFGTKICPNHHTTNALTKVTNVTKSPTEEGTPLNRERQRGDRTHQPKNQPNPQPQPPPPKPQTAREFHSGSAIGLQPPKPPSTNQLSCVITTKTI
jgi:hypothetical protein